MKNIKLSLYNNIQSTEGQVITLDDYIIRIKHGVQTKDVIKAREYPHGSEEYENIKKKLPVVTGSAVMNPTGGKSRKNIDHLNGLMLIDLDEDMNQMQINNIKNDPHTLIMHESIGGSPRYCVFVKINPDKFEDSWLTIADYYFSKFGVSIDESCKNVNRLRFLSYDPNIYVNEKARLFRAKSIKKFKPPKRELTRYICTQNDFENIINQIADRGINLTQDEYQRYVQIGMSIASEFDLAGFEYFDAICRPSTKYNYKRGKRDYEGFCKNKDGSITIGTLYYYCKQENIEIYSKRTVDIINSVKVGKAQGKPTVSSVSKHIASFTGEELTPSEQVLAQNLIDSKEDFSSLANSDESEIDILINFIISMFNPYKCVISENLYLDDDTYVDDSIISDIYIACKSNLHEVKNITIAEVRTILRSSKIREVNKLMNVINRHKRENPTGYIRKYIESIPAESKEMKEYNYWAFKRWICGTVHNWTRDKSDTLVSPLTIVLTGRKQGTGKTSFFEFILPEELSNFFAKSRISDNKDNLKRMCTNLILVDDEFTGDGTTEQGRLKTLLDTKEVVERFAYGYVDTRMTRRCGYGSTTNEVDILRDETGNRRLLPISVESRIDYDYIKSFPSELLITEAYNLIQNGFDWIIRTEEDMNYLASMTQKNMEIDPYEDLFFRYFSLEQNDHYCTEVIFNQGEILNYILSNTNLKPTAQDMRRVFIRNKMDYKPHRTGGKVKQGYKVFMPFDWEVKHYATINSKVAESKMEEDSEMPF